jgi:4-amino-4-deoxy-L-arabinose transferase-like glycosyltransferase
MAVLTSLLAVAAALRLYRLDDGLWWDEIFMYVKFVKMPLAQLLTTYESENQHFLYILLARASIWIFGDSVWSLRFPAVLFGVASIWALYLLGRQVSGAREGLLAAALLTFSYHHIWFSQNARGYIGLLFWTILASWFFLRATSEARPRWWLLYAAAAALGVYTHLFMIFVVIGHFIIHIPALRDQVGKIASKRRDALFAGFCLAGLFTVLLYAPILPQLLSYDPGTESHAAVWKSPLWTLSEFIRGMELGFAGGIGAMVVLLMFGAGLLSYARTDRVLIGLMVIPALICAAVVIGVGHHFWPRYFFFTVGFASLIIVRGAMVLGGLLAGLLNFESKKSVLVGTALCAGFIFVSALSVPSVYSPKQDYSAALLFVEANQEPGDVVVTAGLAYFPYQKLYRKDWESVETLDTLNTARSNAKRTWLLYTLSPQLETLFPEIMDAIRRDFRVIKQFPGTLGGGTIYVSRADMPPSTSGK